MPLTLSIKTRDSATAAIAARVASCSPARLALAIARDLADFWRNHLRALPPNKYGYPSTGFWQDAANSVTATPLADSVQLQSNKVGLRQRYYGGPISPTDKSALTIPISPISYGKRASDFTDLFLLRTKKGAYLVQWSAGKKSSRKNPALSRDAARGSQPPDGLLFLFKLSPGVNQDPNPNVLPSTADFAAVTLNAIQKSIP